MGETALDTWTIGPGTIDGPLPGPDTVGGKAHGLLRLARRGIAVPPGFVLSTAFCRRYQSDPKGTMADAQASARTHLATLEAVTGTRFGDARNPLLVSVRSGAAESMPGMLETVLNIGCNRSTVRGLMRRTGDPRFAWDCYGRLIQQFSTVVCGASARSFEQTQIDEMTSRNAESVRDLDFSALEGMAQHFERLFRSINGRPFPQDPHQQLAEAIDAVIRSWGAEKARTFRRVRGISDTDGTAVTVQAMVFGNTGAASASGVGFTRDPATGAKRLYIDFLLNAQGEDVVSGRYTADRETTLREVMPAAAAEIERVAGVLEDEFGDMQDFEFTIDGGRLYVLQTRTGYRSPLAAVRIAVDMVDEGLIDPSTALERLAGIDMDALERRRLAVPDDTAPLAAGLPAAAGVAVGQACFTTEQVAQAVSHGKPAILLLRALSTDDIAGIADADGIVTATGARTSHAAVVARQLGKACVVACPRLSFSEDGGTCFFDGDTVLSGEDLSVDGETGAVYRGLLSVTTTRPDDHIRKVGEWRKTA